MKAYLFIIAFICTSLSGNHYARTVICDTGDPALQISSVIQGFLKDKAYDNGSHPFDRMETLKGMTGITINKAVNCVLPPEISSLTMLHGLWADGSKLTSLPSEIGGLRALEDLDLRDNRLTILPPEIGTLPHLAILNLAENPLTDLPDTFGQLASLAILYLPDTLKSHPTLPQLTGLRELYLYNEFGLATNIVAGQACIQDYLAGL